MQKVKAAAGQYFYFGSNPVSILHRVARCATFLRVQSFQECVCENSARVNALLYRGEALIQRGDPADAHLVESSLLELLGLCSHVYSNIGRTHTRLLSMRLVHPPQKKNLEDKVAVSPKTVAEVNGSFCHKTRAKNTTFNFKVELILHLRL